MNPVREGIVNKLKESSDLTDLLSDEDAIFYRLAEPGTPLPYVIYNEMTDADLTWPYAGGPIESVKWLIKGVSQTAGEAEDISEQIKLVMDRAELTVAGQSNLLCMRTSNVSYMEDPTQTDGERYEHHGAIYKITNVEVTP